MMNRIEVNREDERERDRLEESNKKEEHRIRKMETKAVQNLNLYLIFQAVILASTSLALSATCRNSWIPITLSLLAAVTNFISFFADVSRILKSRQQLDQSISDLAFVKLYQLTTHRLDQVQPGASFDHQGRQIVRSNIKKWKRRLVAYLSVALFAGFTAIVMYGCHRILCQPG